MPVRDAALAEVRFSGHACLPLFYPLSVLLLRYCPMPCIQAGGLDNFALRSAALLSNRLDIVATAATVAKE